MIYVHLAVQPKVVGTYCKVYQVKNAVSVHLMALTAPLKPLLAKGEIY